LKRTIDGAINKQETSDNLRQQRVQRRCREFAVFHKANTGRPNSASEPVISFEGARLFSRNQILHRGIDQFKVLFHQSRQQDERFFRRQLRLIISISLKSLQI
jgi:hypothetical protein